MYIGIIMSQISKSKKNNSILVYAHCTPQTVSCFLVSWFGFGKMELTALVNSAQENKTIFMEGVKKDTD